MITQLVDEHNILPENIRCRGQSFTTLGEIITIGPHQIGPGPSITEWDKKIQRILGVWSSRNYHGNLSGRSLATSTYLQSQIAHLLANATLKEDDLIDIQRIINRFVNKKQLTSGDTIYLSKAKGGTDTPHLYSRYLSLKIGWIPKLVNAEI